MSLTPVHEDLKEMLPAAALEILETGELEQVMAHVRDCPECETELQEYREAVTALSLRLPARQLDPARARALRARILARARENRSDSETAMLPSLPRATAIIYRWSGWMVAAGLGGVLLVHHSIHQPLDRGWLVAAVLLVILIGLGIYVRVQRSRVSALQAHLADLGAKGERADRGGPGSWHTPVPPQR